MDNGDLRAPLALGEDIVVGGVARVGRGVVAALLRSREPGGIESRSDVLVQVSRSHRRIER